MTTFTTSRGTRASHVGPRSQPNAYRQTHGQRDYIHGRVQPMDSPYAQPAWHEIVVMLLVAGLIGFLLAGGM